MKNYKRAVWLVLAFHFILLMVVILGFKVDDMTLSKGETYTFNKGWTVERQTGEMLTVDELPYLGRSAPYELIVMENVIPRSILA